MAECYIVRKGGGESVDLDMFLMKNYDRARFNIYDSGTLPTDEDYTTAMTRCLALVVTIFGEL